ncbi:hypothetical protein [Bradyrhizobium sp. CCBAU 45389]|uniref:hypothetical protein n=1 Tax=Bradyrhizobium sp. CCBAU 45389 TaxID=858429 RepID=UPI0023067337|nr:hypothetical protein [Bradyrhizobium sp. CCBAU 45389]MBR0706277.1 hypothetical protein [Bradyrhizobium liaoningense]
MPKNPRPVRRFQISRSSEYDRGLVERAREVFKLAKKVLAEFNPSILLRRSTKPPSEGQ